MKFLSEHFMIFICFVPILESQLLKFYRILLTIFLTSETWRNPSNTLFNTRLDLEIEEHLNKKIFQEIFWFYSVLQ